MIERRLCRCWKSNRLFCWWDDGRIRAVRARFTQSPSTVPIRTSEFVIADRRRLSRPGEHEAEWESREAFLCIEQRNEPGWLVGEHIHVRFILAGFETTWSRTETRELGECDRLREMRNGAGVVGERLTLVGDEGRWKRREEDREDDEEDAKLDGSDEIEKGSDGWDMEFVEWEYLRGGESERWKPEKVTGRRTGAFERDFEDAAIDESLKVRREKKWREGYFGKFKAPRWGDGLANCVIWDGKVDL